MQQQRTPAPRYGSVAIIGLITALNIICFGTLASQIHRFEPATSWTDISNPVSCDLTSGDVNSLQNAFNINLRGTVKLTFTQAKAIDVAWQLIVGAGGRFLMGWIAYKAFMDGLTRLMEQTAVSYDLHASLTFSTDSLLAIWHALKTVLKLQGWRGKCFLIWFAIATIYILGFQILMSASAGYVQPSKVGFRMADGSFVNGNSAELRSCFKVPSGALLNMTANMVNGTVITGPPVKDYNIVRHDIGSRIRHDEVPFNNDFNNTFPQFTSLLSGKI